MWGKEILHGTLHTPGGPTWKPLPVVFTTIFAIFGKAQPNLWLMVARAGAFVATVMTGKLAFRMTTWLAQGTDTNGLLPGILAAVAAIVGLAFSSNFLSSSALGYSEGFAIAAIMIGVERHLDGHYRQAFALGFIAALDRPEVWLFWGPYGLWLMWKDPGARPLVIGLALATLALWFVPQKWGSGSWTSGISRANNPRSNSAAYAKCPFCTEFKKDEWPLVLLRTKLAALAAILAACGILLAGWRAASRTAVGVSVLGFNRRALKLDTPRRRAIMVVLSAGILGFGWWVLIALETQAHFSGNTRYIVIGSAFIYLCGSIAFGWAAVELAGLAKRWRASGPASRTPRLASYGATGLMALVFAFAPHWVGGSLISLGKTHKSLLFQADLRTSLERLVAEDGGVARVKSCGAGHVMVEGFQVPMVAWYLGVKTLDVQDQPSNPTQGPPWPNVVFQDRDTGNPYQPVLPLWTTMNNWIKDGAHYTIRTSINMRSFVDCSMQANDPQQVWSR